MDRTFSETENHLPQEIRKARKCKTLVYIVAFTAALAGFSLDWTSELFQVPFPSLLNSSMIQPECRNL